MWAKFSFYKILFLLKKKKKKTEIILFFYYDILILLKIVEYKLRVALLWFYWFYSCILYINIFKLDEKNVKYLEQSYI